jgi:molybdopterin-binding protein
MLIDDVRDWWIRRQVRRLSITAIDRVSDGARVKISGRLDPGRQPLEAPITGRPCAAWSVEVQEGTSFTSILVEVQAQDFALRDGSARAALVRTGQASIVFDSDASVWQRQVTGRMRAFLERHRVPDRGYYGGGAPLRYIEGVLEAGEEVSVVGTARVELDATSDAASYREPPMRVVLDATPRAPLWILDGPARWRLA